MTREEEIEKAKKELADAEEDIVRARKRKSEAQAALSRLTVVGLEKKIGPKAYVLLWEAVEYGEVLTHGPAKPGRDNAARALQKLGFVHPAERHSVGRCYKVTDLGRKAWADNVTEK